MNNHKAAFIISQFLWVRNLGMASLSASDSRSHEIIVRLLSRAEISCEGPTAEGRGQGKRLAVKGQEETFWSDENVHLHWEIIT